MKNNIGPYLDPVTWLTREISQRIRTGGFTAGGFLPSERNLERDTGISRRHVRLALARIETKGLVKRVHGRGTQVLPPTRKNQTIRIGVVYSLNSSGTGEFPLMMEGITLRLNELGVAFDRIPTNNIKPDITKSDTSCFTLASEIHHLRNKYDGLIFVEMNNPKIIPQALTLAREGYPLTVANLEPDLPLAGTRMDHAGVARKAVELLVSLGHRRIGYVGWNEDYLFYARTLAGFRAGLQANGITPEESLIRYINQGNVLGGYLAALPLFELAEPPTAIVAGRDYIAHAVCQAIEAAGLEIGHDVSVVGFDDVSWDNKAGPILTTFHEPCVELGASAAEMLVDALRSGTPPCGEHILDAELVLRQTVGPPRRNAPVK